jgi:hypothetical protein
MLEKSTQALTLLKQGRNCSNIFNIIIEEELC